MASLVVRCVSGRRRTGVPMSHLTLLASGHGVFFFFSFGFSYGAGLKVSTSRNQDAPIFLRFVFGFEKKFFWVDAGGRETAGRDTPLTNSCYSTSVVSSLRALVNHDHDSFCRDGTANLQGAT